MATSEDLHYLIVFRMDNIINIFDHNLLLLKSVFIRVLEPIDSIRVSQDMDSLILKSPLFKLNLIPSVLKLNLIDDLWYFILLKWKYKINYFSTFSCIEESLYMLNTKSKDNLKGKWFVSIAIFHKWENLNYYLFNKHELI